MAMWATRSVYLAWLQGDMDKLEGHGFRTLAARLAALRVDTTDATEHLTAAVGPGRRRCDNVRDPVLIAAATALRFGVDPGTLRQVVAGLRRWPGWRAAQAAVLVRRTTPAMAVDGVLTARETEVAVLLAEGLSNGQVTKRLYISTKTASTHVSNILAKLRMASRAEVAAWAVREGMATEPG
jgi:DNA-binding CsgD family transcriptional regulator